MAQIIDVPGQGQIEFPDSMKDADIVAAIHKLSGTAQPEKLGTMGNIGAGALSGAAQIGSTLLAPVDWLAKKTGLQRESFDRRAEIESALKGGTALPGVAPADTESLAYQGGKIGAEIAGTAGMGGALAKGAMLGAKAAPVLAPRVAQALGSAGFSTGGAPAAAVGQSALNAALRVGGGAATGGASAGLINPEEASSGAAIGGAFGAASPVIGGAISGVARKLRKPTAAEITSGSEVIANDAIKSISDEIGVPVSNIPADIADFVKTEAKKAFAKGEKIDAAALLRKADFEKLDIKPLLGQITRDPTQYAQELNLRGVSPEISGTIREQNQRLQEIFGEPARSAQEATPAGRAMMDVLQSQDEAAKAQVNALYQAAKGESGRYSNVDHIAFSNEANKILDEQMLGRFLPEQARGLLNDISSGNVPLNVNNLVQVDSVLSAAQRTADDAGKKAIGVVRDALHNAPIESGAGESAKAAFDTARKAARARFSTQEAIPALKAVVQGKADADSFVRKFIVQGKTDEVHKLAAMLRDNSPEQFAQAKSQVAEDIRRAAFGEGITSDSAIRPEMLAKKLRDIGTEKMGAFFSPEEIAQYKLANRVASYIAKHPNAAPVNTSNTLVAQLMTNPAISMAERLPMAGGVISAAKAMTGAVKNQMAASKAVKAEIPVENMPLSESQRKLLAKILGVSGTVISGQLAQ